jgi:DNA-binding NarL/FixJ family response regulator
LRILVVDDHPTVRFGLKHLLASAGFEIVGEAGNAAEAVRLAKDLGPELVLLDLRLGEGSGIEVYREMKALSGGSPRVLVFTAHASVEDVAGATLAGADGYLHKGVEGEKLLDAVRRTHAGQRVWLLPVENEEEAADLARETSGKARLTPKERGLCPRPQASHQPRDRLGALHQPLHRKEPRQQHPAQARVEEPA